MEYVIEEREKSGKWAIVGSYRGLDGNGLAQAFMRNHQKLFPHTAFRVVEMPTRKIQVLHDPNS